MKTIRCPQCNLVNWATMANCKRCQSVLQNAEAATAETVSVGAFQTIPNQPVAQFSSLHDFGFREKPFQPQPSVPNYQPPTNNYAQNNYNQPNYQASYQPTNLKSGLAIASMIFGILAFMMAIFVIGILFAPVGLILAIVALVKASRKPNEYGGKGFAIAGLVTSAMVLMIVPVILAIAIPNLMAARRAANEGSAISTLRTIAKAQGNNEFNGKQMKCLTMPDLAKSQIVNQGLADGEHNGYKFAVTDSSAGGCEVTATPISTSHGNRSFFYSTADGKIRAATKQGASATRNDPMID